MKSQVIFFLLLLTCMTLTLAQVSYSNCCIGVQKRKPHPRRVESYRLQETDGDCNIRAVVFQMKLRPGEIKQKSLCADPDEEWVQRLVGALNMRNYAH